MELASPHVQTAPSVCVHLDIWHQQSPNLLLESWDSVPSLAVTPSILPVMDLGQFNFLNPVSSPSLLHFLRSAPDLLRALYVLRHQVTSNTLQPHGL